MAQFSVGGNTPRQQLIARRVGDELSDKEVARQLSISEKTVRNQLTHIYNLMGVHHRTQLVNILHAQVF